MNPTLEQEAKMRKVAFYVGVARYFHLHGDKPALQKQAFLEDIGKLGTLAAVGIPVLSYVAGRHAGRFAGGMYGNASTPSPATVNGREYDLASAATQRLIDEINADKINKTVEDTLAEPAAETEEQKKAKSPIFSKPGLLRYGR